MRHLAKSDITLDPEWQAEQADRLLGFEILSRACTATYQPIDPVLLSDKIGATKGFSFKIIKNLSRRLNERQQQD